MSRIVYLNGEYIPEEEAKVSIFDRGFVMGDAVYEVTCVLDGKLTDFEGHMARLARSLKELAITCDISRDEWLEIHRKLVAENGLELGGVYLQITRGNAGDRDFHYPPAGTPPTVVLYTQEQPHMLDGPKVEKGVKVISVPDLRWHRRDIKTVQLLWASMSKMAAEAAGKDDAWFVEDGFVTEGSSNNCYIVKGNTIITRPLSNDILHGITRASLFRMCAEHQIKIEERAFTIAEAQEADEAFYTSASAFVMPIVEVDGVALSGGKPGPVAKRLREIYIDEARKAAI
ncbi:MAG: D-amino-acid transaminase [Paenirhodobacter sp.]|uniref:D-amino-acid transaminase n=1 Tax=Paenirhodobacter sp. TaxID=1965326 RepID=UPI003D0E34F5